MTREWDCRCDKTRKQKSNKTERRKDLILFFMCITLPMQIKEVGEGRAIVWRDKKEMEVKINLIPNAAKGDWVLVNANLALKKITAEEAEEINKLFSSYEK
jgi:hydrogenase expression/formation protein HypC